MEMRMDGARGVDAESGNRAVARRDGGGVVLLLLVNGSLVAGVYAAAQVALRHGAAPLGVLAWQLAFAAAALGIVALVRGQWPRIDGRRLRYALVAGLLGVSLPNAASFTALAQLPASMVGVVAALSPIFTYVFAIGLCMERPAAVRTVGMLLGLGGVLWVVWPRDGASFGPAVVLALAAPALLAAGNVYRSLAWPQGLAPLGAAALMLAGQALLVVPLAAASGVLVLPGIQGAPGSAALWSTGAMTAAFYLGAFELQRRGGAVVTGQLGYVITLASLAIGALLLGETHPASSWIGAALAIAGVMLVLRGAAARAPRS
jgi:drug/metabolite transporter (DMT)-like permease